jgi:hypothetical protein
MFYLTLPTGKPSFKFRATFDGVEYVLSLEWNTRGGWYLGLADAAGSDIFAPRKVVPDYDLLSACSDDRRPRGMLIAYDVSGQGRRVGYDSFNTTHKLSYITADEVAAL